MHDPKDRDAAFPLGAYLRLCDPCADDPKVEPCLRRDYEIADESAERGQRAHGRLVRASVTCGLAALFWGLLKQLFGLHDPRVFWLEAGFTSLALILVLVTLLRGTHKTWLTERYKAEYLRLIKFRLLIEPGLWSRGTGDLAAVRHELETGRAKIANTPHTVLEALAHGDALPDLPATADCLTVESPALGRLLEYYRRKRLDSQLRYFERKMGEKPGWIENPVWQPLMFFVGLALSLANLLLEGTGFDEHRYGWVLPLFVFGSRLAPFGWGAIRTLRGAHERTRNQARSHARYDALAEIRKSLDKSTVGDPSSWDRPQIFGYLYLCEGLLAADQHEWLRLMTEAETYG